MFVSFVTFQTIHDTKGQRQLTYWSATEKLQMSYWQWHLVKLPRWFGGESEAGRQGRTTGYHSSLFRSMELCSNNSRFSCVEWWCTPDKKYLQVEIHVFCSRWWVTDNVYGWIGTERERERKRERECVCICVCVCVCVWVGVTRCLNSTYSATGGCVCTFSVFVISMHGRSLTYMANVFWLGLCKYKPLQDQQYLSMIYVFKYTLI